jgi:hypothetical protein
MPGAQHFRSRPRPDAPSGEQLVEELREHARANGKGIGETVQQLCGANQHPSNWIQQMMRTKCPRQATVDRVRALLAGSILPPRAGSHRPTSIAPRCGRIIRPHRNAKAKAILARQIQASQAAARAAERAPTPEEKSARPSDLIRWATEEWPEVAEAVRDYAAETDQPLGEAWRSVITAGLQCLRED